MRVIFRFLLWKKPKYNSHKINLIFDICFDIFVNDIKVYIYIYVNCTVNMELTVSEKSVFPTSFGRCRFQGNLFSFQILFDVICLQIRHNGVSLFLTAVDEN